MELATLIHFLNVSPWRLVNAAGEVLPEGPGVGLEVQQAVAEHQSALLTLNTDGKKRKRIRLGAAPKRFAQEAKGWIERLRGQADRFR